MMRTFIGFIILFLAPSASAEIIKVKVNDGVATLPSVFRVGDQVVIARQYGRDAEAQTFPESVAGQMLQALNNVERTVKNSKYSNATLSNCMVGVLDWASSSEIKTSFNSYFSDGSPPKYFIVEKLNFPDAEAKIDLTCKAQNETFLETQD
ncbi:MAG: hypothetical protein ABJN22_05575 [Litorimonas sp.]